MGGPGAERLGLGVMAPLGVLTPLSSSSLPAPALADWSNWVGAVGAMVRGGHLYFGGRPVSLMT